MLQSKAKDSFLIRASYLNLGALLFLSVIFYGFYPCHDLKAGFGDLINISGHFRGFVPVSIVEVNNFDTDERSTSIFPLKMLTNKTQPPFLALCVGVVVLFQTFPLLWYTDKVWRL